MGTGLEAAHRLAFEVAAQPTGSTCGPTCLHALYRYYDDLIELGDVIREVEPLPGGGTLAVRLACHALRRGYAATIYTYNLQLFDPSWFTDTEVDLVAKLEAQQAVKADPRLEVATRAYVEFFGLGGRLVFEELSPDLIRRWLRRNVPILTGLSSTYLYGCARERDDQVDDVGGEPTGHFVVLSGYDPARREVMVADPLHDNPRFGTRYYRVGVPRLIASILLGIVTYDANLLLITPTTRS